MAILVKGRPEERLAFLFNVYDEDHSGGLSKRELENYIQIFKTLLPKAGEPGGNFIQSLQKAYKQVETELLLLLKVLEVLVVGGAGSYDIPG
jgi:Ca2+-binding EF-hand superfamily protein